MVPTKKAHRYLALFPPIAVTLFFHVILMFQWMTFPQRMMLIAFFGNPVVTMVSLILLQEVVERV